MWAQDCSPRALSTKGFECLVRASSHCGMVEGRALTGFGAVPCDHNLCRYYRDCPIIGRGRVCELYVGLNVYVGTHT